MAANPPKWHSIYTRVREPVWKKIERYAKADGLTPTEFVRNCINAELEKRRRAETRKRDARKREREQHAN